MKHAISISTGVLLIILGLFGAVYSIRTACAQKIYHSVKYGSLTNASSKIIEDNCIKANNLYSHNYNLCNIAAKLLWTQALKSSADNKRNLIKLVGQWCDKGLEENYYDLSLRYRKTELIALSSKTEAADYWKLYSDWNFWNAQSLSLLVKYYAKAGRLVEATEVLSLLKGHPDYAVAAAYLHNAWAKEMNFKE